MRLTGDRPWPIVDQGTIAGKEAYIPQVDFLGKKCKNLEDYGNPIQRAIRRQSDDHFHRPD
jgi:hypothetical protein